MDFCLLQFYGRYKLHGSSLVGYPTAIRKVTIDGEKIDVRTEQIDTFDFDRKGLSVKDYLKNHFTFFLNEDVYKRQVFSIRRAINMSKFPEYKHTKSHEYFDRAIKVIPLSLIHISVEYAYFFDIGSKLFCKAEYLVNRNYV